MDKQRAVALLREMAKDAIGIDTGRLEAVADWIQQTEFVGERPTVIFQHPHLKAPSGECERIWLKWPQ